LSRLRTVRRGTERREGTMLMMLIAVGEKTLEEFEASNNPEDSDFVADLERIVARSRNQLAALEAF
jgi:hypothetical protein